MKVHLRNECLFSGFMGNESERGTNKSRNQFACDLPNCGNYLMTLIIGNWIEKIWQGSTKEIWYYCKYIEIHLFSRLAGPDAGSITSCSHELIDVHSQQRKLHHDHGHMAPVPEVRQGARADDRRQGYRVGADRPQHSVAAHTAADTGRHVLVLYAVREILSYSSSLYGVYTWCVLEEDNWTG